MIEPTTGPDTSTGFVYRFDKKRLELQYVEIRLNRNVPEGTFTSAFQITNARVMSQASVPTDSKRMRF